MTVQMDERYASALRAALIEHVENAPARRRRTGLRVAGASGVGALVLGGGLAAATGLLQLPGGPVVTSLAQSVTVTGEGTQTVELGNSPARTTDIDIKITCLTPGTFISADGAQLECVSSDAGTGTMAWHLALAPGQHTTVVKAGSGERWRVVATYVDIKTSEWGVNADGLSYGVANANGTPDLIAAIATNGKTGYINSRDLDQPKPATPQTGAPPSQTLIIPVYTSDGHTVIGDFVVAPPVDGYASPAP
jgi:hypothetical protein